MGINVMLWGAGAECEKNMRILPPEWNIQAIVDCNKRKEGEHVAGYRIIGASEIEKYSYDYIVITSSKYAGEIRKDIRNCGISMLKVIDGARAKKNLSVEEHWCYFRNLLDGKKRQYDSPYIFENRGCGKRKLFYVLAGYKPMLWEDVSNRMKMFIPEDVDVCVLSSGKYVQQLADDAEKNGWSYLSTEINDVGIIQNLVISFFPKAEYIFKMDEDVYITKGSCEKMFSDYQEALSGKFDIGFIGPMIPLHTNGYLFIDRFNLDDKYQELTGQVHIPGGRWTNPGYAIDPSIPKFLWSQGNIDDLNRIVSVDEPFTITPIKYAICFILFERKTFEDMGGFRIVPETRTAGVNGDEGQIMEYCMHSCKCTIVATNCICGHFSYPDQENEMLLFREENRQYFEING